MASIVSVRVPIWLTLIRMLLAIPSSMPRCRRSVLVTNRSSPTSCNAIAQPLGHQLPAVPIIFAAAIFDRADGVVVDPFGQEVDHRGRDRSPCRRSDSDPSWRRRTRWRPRPRRSEPARPACSPAFSIASRIRSRASTLLPRSGAKPPSSPTAVFSFLACSTFFRWWKISTPQRRASLKLLEPQRHDHEFLDVDRVIGMLAAVDDVHHRSRQQTGADAAQVAVQRLLGVMRGRFGHGHRDAQDGVGPQVLLVRPCRPNSISR